MKSLSLIFVFLLSNSILYCGTQQDKFTIVTMANNTIILKSKNEKSFRLGRHNIENRCEDSIPVRSELELFKNEDAFMLDFSNGQISTMTLGEVSNIIKESYFEIKSKFSKSHVRIFLNVNWRETAFTFDTAFQGTFAMKPGNRDRRSGIVEIFEKINAFNGKIQTVKYHNNRIVRFGNTNYNTSIWIGENEEARVGIGFIKGFDWIFDLVNRKVYARKNSLSIDIEDVTVKDYYVVKRNASLEINMKNTKARQFALGQKIVSVGGVEVNAENFCDIDSLLKQSRKWDKLRIEVQNQ